MDLLLFDREDDARPARVIRIDPLTNRTYHYWHVFVPGVKAGQIYGYRVMGRSTRRRGLRFDPTKVLLDPYGRGVVVPQSYSREAARKPGDNAATAMKSVVVDPRAYDWEGDAPLERPSARTDHLRDARARLHAASQFRRSARRTRGTYAGLIEKIPYLQELGITAVELLPVFQFDAQDCPPGRVNYWGYAPVSFFAPHPAYSSRQDPLGPLDEFRDMVKALHRAGIEVILDVVFNHTAEGDRGRADALLPRASRTPPTTSWSQTAPATPTTAAPATPSTPTIPIVRRLILDSLRYWVERDARGRLPLRPGLDPRARRQGPRAAQPAGALGHRIGPGAGRHEADRRGLGCRRALPGGQLRRRQLEGVERAVPRRRARLLPRRPRARCSASPTG